MTMNTIIGSMCNFVTFSCFLSYLFAGSADTDSITHEEGTLNVFMPPEATSSITEKVRTGTTVVSDGLHYKMEEILTTTMNTGRSTETGWVLVVAGMVKSHPFRNRSPIELVEPTMGRLWATAPNVKPTIPTPIQATIPFPAFLEGPESD